MNDETIADYNIYMFPELDEEIQAQVIDRIRGSNDKYSSLSDIDIQDIIELNDYAFLADGTLIEG